MMVRRGEIYLVDLDKNVGSEQAGLRPAIIVQNEIGNVHSPTTIICPLTSKNKPPLSTHVSLRPNDGCCGITKDSTVLCEQVRVIDKARCKKKLGKIQNQKIIEEINQKLMVSMGLGGTKEC